jgi:PTS system nitrogen regulatory IIA component
MTPDVLTGDEVAKLLRVSRDTVYRLATRGQLPARKVGRIWRFSEDAIRKYVEGGSAVGQNSRAADGRHPGAADSGDDKERQLASARAPEP